MKMDDFSLTYSMQTNKNLDVRDYKIAILGSLGPPELEIDHVFTVSMAEYIEPNKGPPVFTQNPTPRVSVFVGQEYAFLMPQITDPDYAKPEVPGPNQPYSITVTNL
jgi:hypothetical protein